MKHWLISTHPVSHALYTQIQTDKNRFQQLAYIDLRTRSDAVWRVGRSGSECDGVRRVWRSVAECDGVSRVWRVWRCVAESGECGGMFQRVAEFDGVRRVWRCVAEGT